MIYYAVSEFNEIKKEKEEKWLEGKGFITVMYEHFTEDLYNLLDVVSIFVSMLSNALFLSYWLSSLELQGDYDDLQDDTWEKNPYPDFLETIYNMQANMTLYVRLSW